VSPRYDTKPAWWILKELAKRLDLGHYLPFETIEDIWNFQLEGTGIKIEDFSKQGFVTLADKAIWWDRDKTIQFKTPSGKIELISTLMENAGFSSFVPYEPVSPVPEGHFRLMVGRCAVHTHVSTQNNLYLNELVPENELWINTKSAAALGIKDGQFVEISSSLNTNGKLRAKVTDLIHPEAVFMLHGFGKTVPAQTRCYQKGASDALIQENISDKAGGSPALDETLVTVRPVQ
jgi:thiosulfate reductase/polysulfide reductase chain A